jgi:uncharacterized protein with ATP-grasp and redox domains
MISDHRCFACFTRAFEKLVEKENISVAGKESFNSSMTELFRKRKDSFSAPLLSRDLHLLLRTYTNNPDPYKKEKRINNDLALSMLPRLEYIVSQSGDPFKTALRLAIAGNIMDFAANGNFNLGETIDKALLSDFAIDHSNILKERIEKALSVLYLGDNAGEIVFDKLLIQTINHPNLTYAVRGAPVINDATIEDAEYVGMNDIANVISNGYDAPSTVPDKSSNEFKKYFWESQLIISKGQGNLEGLLPLNDERIFFLLTVKCDVIAEYLKVDKNSFVVCNTCSG